MGQPVELTGRAAIQFLTKTGQTCTDLRQEFILASDAFGVSALVDTINHPKPKGATESTVLGPFFVEDARTVSLLLPITYELKLTPSRFRTAMRSRARTRASRCSSRAASRT